MHDQDTYARTRAPVGTSVDGGGHEAGDTRSTVTVAADTAKETATGEARVVAATAKHEAGAVMEEAGSQVRRLASQARDQAKERVHGSHHQLVDRLRGLSDELREMGKDGSTPGRALVGDVGQRGQRVADYLADRGPEGLLSEVTDFARRRPLAFLAGAMATGFLVGRLGKGVWKARSESADAPQVNAPQPVADSTAGYPEPYREPTVDVPQWTDPVPAAAYDDPYRAARPYGSEPR